MASMLLRACRDAARAAPSAASVASRCAAVAASGSGGAAASNRLLRRLPIASRSFGRGLGSDRGDDFPVASPPRFNRPGPDPGKVKFVVDDKDRESDEALWALYERWCKAFEQERDPDEMRRRFNTFKEMVFFVDRANNEAIRNGQSVRYAVNMFADGKLGELLLGKVTFGPVLNHPNAWARSPGEVATSSRRKTPIHGPEFPSSLSLGDPTNRQPP